MIVGAVHTKAPEVYIRITQDKKIYIKAPAGYTLETDAAVEIKAGGTVTVKAPRVEIDAPKVHMTGDLDVDGHIHGD